MEQSEGKSHSQNQNGKLPKSKIDKIQWEQIANRVGSYLPKGGHVKYNEQT